MDLIRKRKASNIQARFSCAGLLTAYCLFALFTSLPSQTANHNQRNLSQQAANLPVPDPLPEVQTKNIVEWWQQHQELAFLHEKWWQRHHPANAVKTVKAPTQKALTQENTAKFELASAPKAKPVPKAAIKTANVEKQAAQRPKPSVKTTLKAPIEAKGKPAVLVKPAAKKPEPKIIASPALLPSLDTASPSQKPVKLAKIKPDAKIALASLSPLPASFLGKVAGNLAAQSNADYESLLPAFIKKAFKAHDKRPAKKTEAARCVADNIAGWSGIKLLPRHIELLKKTSSTPSQVSLALTARLDLGGFTAGSQIFIRIFKNRSELEVWLKKGERYALYHTYKICRWSGSFGPKLYEGDKQSPEGFYTVNRQLFKRPSWKWKGSFSLGYPNAYDKLHGRTGSLILVHGGCTSSGCFAMTDPVINEVRELAQLARDNGQKEFNVHVFPFKLTAANLAKHKHSPWKPFWNNLKEGYDLFEKTGLPPRVRVCDKRYVFAPNGVDRAGAGWSGKGCYGLAAYIPGWKQASRYATKNLGKKAKRAARKARRAGVRSRCNLNRASCRKFVALKRKKSSKRRAKLSKRKRLVRKKRLTRKKRLAAKRRATMRRARAIGRKQKKRAFKSNGGNS